MGDRRDPSFPTFSERICIVLFHPEHEGNIGAVARTILNFGINDLRVVGRSTDWSDEARKRAKNAQKVLDHAKSFDSLESSVSDCSIVVGTSGKREDGEKTSTRHFLLPEELPQRIEEMEGKIALVFGPEGKGLLNHQLAKCDILVTIPTWEGYPILNLSHAVSIICYSWYTNSKTPTPPGAGGRLLDPNLRAILRNEVKRLVQSMPTKEHKRKGIEEAMIRVIMRGLPKDDEIHRLLGLISQAADSFENNL
ncbi:MAG: hypothetical protein CMB67_00620 [Euryarchaeota archaeon]|nr:hypothetical protein [Euryarchaeota archaeon]